MTTLANSETENIGALVPQEVRRDTAQNWSSTESLIAERKAVVERLYHRQSLLTLVVLLCLLGALCLIGIIPWLHFADGNFVKHVAESLSPNLTSLESTFWEQLAEGSIIIIVLSVLYLVVNSYLAGRVNAARTRLEDSKRQYLQTRFKTREGWFSYLQIELGVLSDRLYRVLVENTARYSQAEALRREAQQEIIKEPNEVNLVGIQSRLSKIKNIIEIDKTEKTAEAAWQNRTIITMLFYVFLIVSVCGFARVLKLEGTTPVPIFGLNLAIIMWAAVGSLAAILYRFYTSYTADDKIPYRVEFRWLIARPLIGIIMGGLATLAVRTGIVLFTGATPVEVQDEVGTVQVTYWIVAFLAGFSDKFYNGIIELLIARTVSSGTQNAEDTATS